MVNYGFTNSRANYKLDHLIPSEVGGAPSGVKNLWLGPGYGANSFHYKDSFENYLHSQVCS